jgi:preprotein translocase subunit SecF
MALLLVIGGIVAYLALRFEWRFAVSAIIANLHDVIIILGFFACSSGSSRCRCWPRCWRCWATR